VSDKPTWLREDVPPLGPSVLEEQTDTGTRLGSLLVVDEMMASIEKTLRANGDLERTILAITSGNGCTSSGYSGEEHAYELCDLASDPYQLDNLHATPRGAQHRAVEIAALQARLQELARCSGASCRSCRPIARQPRVYFPILTHCSVGSKPNLSYH
jgi:hypothetical protein